MPKKGAKCQTKGNKSMSIVQEDKICQRKVPNAQLMEKMMLESTGNLRRRRRDRFDVSPDRL